MVSGFTPGTSSKQRSQAASPVVLPSCRNRRSAKPGSARATARPNPEATTGMLNLLEASRLFKSQFGLHDLRMSRKPADTCRVATGWMSLRQAYREHSYTREVRFSTQYKLEYSEWRETLILVPTHTVYVSSRYTCRSDITYHPSRLYIEQAS